ncbi:MAG: putative aminoacrylate hydrolase RutD [Acidimicrobiales bacterium]|nr:putative aminoacrylate hydrolase RutD [Acidimicrobiales bacterium]RIK05816.1 MAG: hypothetical protein DCC48_09115 [Acidobacteriota bacterium]
MRSIAGVLGLAAATATGLALWERLAVQRDHRRYPHPSQLIDIGGRSLHYEEAGEGPVTVVLEAGLASDSTSWDRVFPLLSRTAHVIRYDRAGMGWSEAGPLPRTSTRINEDLWDLLQGVAPDHRYLLVGHSRGGIWQRLLAAHHPEAIAGLVLVDSSSEYELDDPGLYASHRRLSLALNSASSVPVARRLVTLAAHLRASRLESGEVPTPPALVANLISPKGAAAFASEVDQTAATYTTVKAIRDAERGFPWPVVVLSRGYHGRSATADAEARLQHRLAELTPDTLHVVAPHSGHFIPMSSPELVAEAVDSALRAAVPT